MNKIKVSDCCKADFNIGVHIQNMNYETNPKFTYCQKCRKECKIVEIEKVDQRGVGDIERDNFYV